jgi:DNA-binding GntR family transcriptional regulator
MYRQIAEDLRGQIESGQLQPGQQLRTETELRDHYGASRNTVRDAIKWLTNLGLVETKPGQGTFVVSKIEPFVTSIGLDAAALDLMENPAYLSEVHAANRFPSVTDLQVEVQLAGAQVEAGLGLSERSRVIARHHRRYIDRTPWSMQTMFYPMSFVERGAERLLVSDAISDGELAYLQQSLGLRQVGWRETIAVRDPNASEASFFGLPEDGGVPVFEVLRTGYDENGTPLRLTVTVYPADRNSFVVSPTMAELGGRAPAEQAQDADSPAEAPMAEQAESEARIALAQLAFDEAARLLRSAIDLDPGRAARLQPDLNCLSEQPGDSPGRLAWRRGLWLTLAAGSPLQLPEPEPIHDDTFQAIPEPAIATASIPGSKGQPRPSRKPQKAGEDLEVAFVRLMERFFSLSADDETRIVKRLRRQSAGTQFGHDVQFDCTTVANRVVSCHVECKNYTRELKTSDVAEKILQTQTYWERKEIDYFLILTPLAGISNDLDHFIQTANSRGDLPFRIQVWGPAEGVEQFFAIEPSAYRAVYRTEPPPVPDVGAVVTRWTDKLKPVLRLPSPLKGYLTNARMHSLGGEDHAHFNALLGESIEVDAVDPAGSPLGRLSDVLAGWIDDPVGRRFLLLGEFGDGKSFACYRLTRFLAGKYLDDPSSGYFPLRLPLRDLIKAGNPQELLSRRLQTLGADMPDWALVQDISPTLVVLDGFDEISDQLDHDTVRNNLNLLGECVEYFRESKILVTSRTHFFDTGSACWFFVPVSS